MSLYYESLLSVLVQADDWMYTLYNICVLIQVQHPTLDKSSINWFQTSNKRQLCPMDIILLSTHLFSLCSALFPVGLLSSLRDMSVVEHELLIQTESGAVTDPVAVGKKEKTQPTVSLCNHFLPPPLHPSWAVKLSGNVTKQKPRGLTLTKHICVCVSITVWSLASVNGTCFCQ